MDHLQQDTGTTRLLSSHMWVQSSFAPRACCLRAKGRFGDDASGMGRTRALALDRCLSEAMEAEALHAVGGAAALGYSPTRDGLAAHPDASAARRHATHEALERLSVARWWLGERPARPLDESWLAATGITAHLAAERQGADQKRPSRFWLICGDAAQPGADMADASVVICRSTSLHGQEPVLGFGCHTSAVWAAMQALREVLLMELNVMTLHVARSNGTLADHAALQAAISTYARRLPALLPETAPVQPAADRASPALPRWFTEGLALRDITPPGGPLPVWLCQPALPAPVFHTRAGLPFLNTRAPKGNVP